MNSLVTLLQALIAFQGLVLSVHLLVGRRGKRFANRSLAALLVLLAWHMVAIIARSRGVDGILLEVPNLFGLLYGPLLLLYVRGLTHQDAGPRPDDALHVVPFLAVALMLATGSLPERVLVTAIFASVGSYLALVLLALRRYRAVLRDTRSHTEAITLSWLRDALLLFTLVWLLDMGSYASSFAAPRLVSGIVTVLLFALLLIFVTTAVFRGLRHPELFAGITLDDEAISREGAKALEKHRGGGDLGVDARRLQTFMAAERPWLDPDLTIAELAARFGMPARELSHLINGELGCNFSELVNGYRVDAAVERLAADPGAEESILEVLQDVGFNSKSVFNAAFKRRTGMTPSQLRERHSPS